MTQLSEELVQRLSSGGDLGKRLSNTKTKSQLCDGMSIKSFIHPGNEYFVHISEGMMSGELFEQNDLYITGNQDDSNSQIDNEIIMHMDIREPLKTLQ